MNAGIEEKGENQSTNNSKTKRKHKTRTTQLPPQRTARERLLLLEDEQSAAVAMSAVCTAGGFAERSGAVCSGAACSMGEEGEGVRFVMIRYAVVEEDEKRDLGTGREEEERKEERRKSRDAPSAFTPGSRSAYISRTGGVHTLLGRDAGDRNGSRSVLGTRGRIPPFPAMTLRFATMKSHYDK